MRIINQKLISWVKWQWHNLRVYQLIRIHMLHYFSRLSEGKYGGYKNSLRSSVTILRPLNLPNWWADSLHFKFCRTVLGRRCAWDGHWPVGRCGNPVGHPNPFRRCNLTFAGLIRTIAFSPMILSRECPTARPCYFALLRKNGRYYADDMLKWIFK